MYCIIFLWKYLQDFRSSQVLMKPLTTLPQNQNCLWTSIFTQVLNYKLYEIEFFILYNIIMYVFKCMLYNI